MADRNRAQVRQTPPTDLSNPEWIESWRLPVFGDKIGRVPAFLVPRFTEMASELPGSSLDRRIYYERVHALLAVALVAFKSNPAAFDLEQPPTEAEKRFGAVLGQAFHQGISLTDVSLATSLPGERIVAIGQRTIRRREWLKRL